MPQNYSLTELADQGGVTVRTIRYYVAQGLLPSPGAGAGARYTESHLLRLRLIRQLQAQHLPLAEIRGRLAELTDDDIRRLLEERARPDRTSALDYIRGVLDGPTKGTMFALAMPARPAPRSMTRSMARLADMAAGSPYERAPEPDLAEPPAPAPNQTFNRSFDRSQWDRIELAPDVELHVRRPLSRLQNKRVERLISIAREILEEDQP